MASILEDSVVYNLAQELYPSMKDRGLDVSFSGFLEAVKEASQHGKSLEETKGVLLYAQEMTAKAKEIFKDTRVSLILGSFVGYISKEIRGVVDETSQVSNVDREELLRGVLQLLEVSNQAWKKYVLVILN